MLRVGCHRLDQSQIQLCGERFFELAQLVNSGSELSKFVPYLLEVIQLYQDILSLSIRYLL